MIKELEITTEAGSFVVTFNGWEKFNLIRHLVKDTLKIISYKTIIRERL